MNGDMFFFILSFHLNISICKIVTPNSFEVNYVKIVICDIHIKVFLCVFVNEGFVVTSVFLDCGEHIFILK